MIYYIVDIYSRQILPLIFENYHDAIFYIQDAYCTYDLYFALTWTVINNDDSNRYDWSKYFKLPKI